MAPDRGWDHLMGGALTRTLGRTPAGSPYSEIGNLGFTTDAGTGATSPLGDVKVGSVITVPVGGVWVKHAYATFTAGSSSVNMRPVLYSGSGAPSNTLFQEGQQLTSTNFATLTELGPWDWVSGGSALFIPAGDYIMCMMVSASGMSFRAANGSTNLYRNNDTYSDGASATFGTFNGGPFGASLKMRIPYSLGGP